MEDQQQVDELTPSLKLGRISIKLILIVIAIVLVVALLITAFIIYSRGESTGVVSTGETVGLTVEPTDLPQISYAEYTSTVAEPTITSNYPSSWRIEIDELTGASYDVMASDGGSEINFDRTQLGTVDFRTAALERLTYFGSYSEEMFDLSELYSGVNINGLEYVQYEINEEENHQLVVMLAERDSNISSFIFLEFQSVDRSIIENVIQSVKTEEVFTLSHINPGFSDLTLSIPNNWDKEFVDGENQSLTLSKENTTLIITRGNIHVYECIQSDVSKAEGSFSLYFDERESVNLKTEIGELLLVANPFGIESRISKYIVCGQSSRGDYLTTSDEYGQFEIYIDGTEADLEEVISIINSFR